MSAVWGFFAALRMTPNPKSYCSGAHAGEEGSVLLLAREGGGGIGRWSGLAVVGTVGDDLGGQGLRGMEHGVGERVVGGGETIVEEVEIVVGGGARLGAEVVDSFSHAWIGGVHVVEVAHGELKTVEDASGDMLVDALLNESSEDVDDGGLNLFGSFEVAELDAGDVVSIVKAATTFAESGFVMVVAVGASAECGRAADESVGLNVMAATDFVHKTSVVSR
jgi:hypothetical protein